MFINLKIKYMYQYIHSSQVHNLNQSIQISQILLMHEKYKLCG